MFIPAALRKLPTDPAASAPALERYNPPAIQPTSSIERCGSLTNVHGINHLRENEDQIG